MNPEDFNYYLIKGNNYLYRFPKDGEKFGWSWGLSTVSHQSDWSAGLYARQTYPTNWELITLEKAKEVCPQAFVEKVYFKFKKFNPV